MKIAIVTGGSRGLGKSMALHIAAKGNDVILTYNSKRQDAEEVVKQIEHMGRKGRALELDVSSMSSINAFVERINHDLQDNWGRSSFDYLVNNAGIGIGSTIAEMAEDQFEQLMKIHLKGPFFLTQKLVPLMNDGGHIVNISTGLTRITLPGYAAYATMKGGLEVLTRYMAHEFGARGIKVNAVAPGAIETDFGHGAVRDNKELNHLIASQTALGRVGLPDDIGSMVASLLSEDNCWVTAQRIEVSGGQAL